MDRQSFVKGAKKYGDFYLYYPKKTDGKTTYMVGTTDLDLPYIKERIGRKLEAAEGFAYVWSWTSDKLRKINVDSVLFIRGLKQEIKRCKSHRSGQTKT